jgi:hypothetical protein
VRKIGPEYQRIEHQYTGKSVRLRRAALVVEKKESHSFGKKETYRIMRYV